MKRAIAVLVLIGIPICTAIVGIGQSAPADLTADTPPDRDLEVGETVTVMDGPFDGAREVLGGYWLISVKSKAEAIEWARRCPAGDGNVIEIRQVQEMADFPADVQKVARL